MTPIHRLHLLLDHHREQMRAYAQGMLPLWKAARRKYEYSDEGGPGWEPAPRSKKGAFRRLVGAGTAAPRAAKETPKRSRRKAAEGPSTFDRSPIERAPKGQGSWQGDPAAVQAAVRAVKDAVSKDEMRYGLTGVHREVVERDGKMFLRLVATDGHRMHIAEVEGTGGEPGRIGHAPATFQQMAADPMDTAVDENAGEFPDFHNVLPSDDDLHPSVVDKRELSRAVSELAKRLDGEEGGIRFVPKGDGFDLYVHDDDAVQHGDPIHVAADVAEGAKAFHLNPRFVLDALRASPGGRIELGQHKGLGPFVIRSDDASGVRTRQIVMPRRESELKGGERRKDRLAREAAAAHSAAVGKIVDKVSSVGHEYDWREANKLLRDADAKVVHSVAEKLTGEAGGTVKASRDRIKAWTDRNMRKVYAQRQEKWKAEAEERAKKEEEDRPRREAEEAERRKRGEAYRVEREAYHRAMGIDRSLDPQEQHENAQRYLSTLSSVLPHNNSRQMLIHEDVDKVKKAHREAISALQSLRIAKRDGRLHGRNVSARELSRLTRVANEAQERAHEMHVDLHRREPLVKRLQPEWPPKS